MVLICNTVKEFTPDQADLSTRLGPAMQDLEASSSLTDKWRMVYLEREKSVESGSAYFAQAFGETLALISDLELSDLHRAELRLGTISTLLSEALEQYEASVELDSQTGLSDYHEARIRGIRGGFNGFRDTLSEARSLDLLAASDERIESIASILDKQGYAQLMEVYLDKVRNIRDLLVPEAVTVAATDAAGWQELGWKLVARFTQAIEIGQGIAIINTR